MYNFFVNETEKQGNCFIITESDFNHISNVLRMKTGDEILVSCNGQASLCKIEIFSDYVKAEVIEENYHNTNLPIKIHLFQGLPKSDKMELIIQKAVELGVSKIIPVEMKRCVVKLDGKNKVSKVSRWQLIAESAAKQSKRNEIPRVLDVLTYNQALEMAKDADLKLFCYEGNPVRPLSDILRSTEGVPQSVFVLIGSEGGFSQKEALFARESGMILAGLGKRILRCETAPTFVLGCLTYEFDL
jgi:16S rRNA (uracil1498-N3)-methyltransferase